VLGFRVAESSHIYASYNFVGQITMHTCSDLHSHCMQSSNARNALRANSIYQHSEIPSCVTIVALAGRMPHNIPQRVLGFRKAESSHPPAPYLISPHQSHLTNNTAIGRRTSDYPMQAMRRCMHEHRFLGNRSTAAKSKRAIVERPQWTSCQLDRPISTLCDSEHASECGGVSI
jgi:hypothetical protein